jgi:3-oxoacyl-(acyl-carrier-protein) synthase
VAVSRIYVCGLGAVSSAGWGVGTLRDALDRGLCLPSQPLEHPGSNKPLKARVIPGLKTRPAFVTHPRLRRASPITHYAVGAALEAVGWLQKNGEGPCRLGIVLCLQSGCVQYSCRFFDEILKDASTASPLVFTETVFAAPASHVATLLDNTTMLCTLTGDPSCFLQGLSLGAQWLEEGRVEASLVIGAEEINWLLADALWHLDRQAVLSGGAGAVCLTRDAAKSRGVELSAITAAHTYSPQNSRARAACSMRRQLPPESPGELLCDGVGESARAHAAERAAWQDWTGARISPKRILGEGLMAAAAWQCVAACDAVAEGRFMAGNVSLVGSNQQAIGARFTRADPGHPQ